MPRRLKPPPAAVVAKAAAAAANPAAATPAPAPAAAPAPKTKADVPEYEEAPHMSAKDKGSGKSLSGKSSSVLVIMAILFLVASWSNIVQPLLNLAWTPGYSSGGVSSTGNLNWKLPLGFLVFIVFAVFLSGVNDTMAGLMLMIAIAMLTVYLVENQGGNLSALFNWLNPAPQSNTTVITQTPGTKSGTTNKGVS